MKPRFKTGLTEPPRTASACKPSVDSACTAIENRNSNDPHKGRSSASPNFNYIARPYRWLEYAVLGHLLQRTRTQFLPRLRNCRHALLFGDGDGRFLAELLKQHPQLAADAVDTSAAMLRLLRKRAEPAVSPLRLSVDSPDCSPELPRLRTHHRNALDYTPDRPHDLIVTHFFLDCLTQPDVDRLAHRLVPTLAPGALWIVSEFRIPSGALRIPAAFLVRALYFAFRLLTGLRVTHLPDHHSALTQAGLFRIAHHDRLFGLLTAELWQKHSPRLEETLL